MHLENPPPATRKFIKSMINQCLEFFVFHLPVGVGGIAAIQLSLYGTTIALLDSLMLTILNGFIPHSPVQITFDRLEDL